MDRYERTALLNSDDFKKKMNNIREKNADISMIKLAEKLSDEYQTDITPAMLKNIERKEVKYELTREGNAEKNLTPFLRSIERRFANLEKTTDKYHKIVERTVDKLSEMDDADLIDNIKDILDVGKQVEATSKMLLSQISIVQAETDKLKLTATKGMVKVDDAVKDVDNYFVNLLKTLEDQGKIEIKDERLIKRKLTTIDAINLN
jgi:hypothetical protein